MKQPLLCLLLLACAGRRTVDDAVAESLALDARDTALSAMAFSPSGAVAPEQAWWTAFESDELDALVARGLADNLTVDAAFARLRAADAAVVGAAGPLFPRVQAELDVATDRDGPLEATAELGASWELDLWGRVRAEARGERERRERTGADAQAAALSLTGEIGRRWLAIAAARSQLALLDDQLAANQGMADVVRARFLNGVVRQADSLRQDRLLEQTRAARIRQRQALELEHQGLAVLLGVSPTAPPPVTAAALPALPPLPATGTPVALIQRRPDVLAAWHALRAADADLAAAVADQFPQLTLSASLRSTGATPRALLTGWVEQLAAGLVVPLFEGRARRAEVRRRRALTEAALADYGQAVLVAFQDVEGALVRSRHQEELVANLEEQVRLAEGSAAGLEAQYAGGLDVGYLDVLTARTTAQQLRRDLIEARRAALETRIDLYLALSGGLEPR